MAVLLFAIFILVLIFVFVPKFLPSLSNKLTQIIVKSFDEEHQCKEELKTLNGELHLIHMVKEFPKYARTERKINKIKSELNALAQKRREVHLKVKLGLNIVFRVLEVFIFIFLIYKFRHEPVIVFPPAWFFPLGSLISFPTAVHGAVSTPFWILICRSTVSKFSTMLSRH